MSTASLKQDRKQILDELERYYQDKLAGVRAKRAGHGKAADPREVCVDHGLRIRVTRQREVILSWDRTEESF